MALEYKEGKLYMINHDGSVIPLGDIYDVQYESISLNYDIINESQKEFTHIPQAIFDRSYLTAKVKWIIKYCTNNWRRNHGLPPIRKSKRRIKYGQ